MGQISVSDRAQSLWRIIQRNPVEVTLIRSGQPLPPQIMLVTEGNGGSSTPVGVGGSVGSQTMTLFGVKGHPSPSVPDADVKRMDRFVMNGKEYTVEVIITTAPGQVQAIGVVRG